MPYGVSLSLSKRPSTSKYLDANLQGSLIRGQHSLLEYLIARAQGSSMDYALIGAAT
jgi:hypothetical protein